MIRHYLSLNLQDLLAYKNPVFFQTKTLQGVYDKCNRIWYESLSTI
jgi:hypothetical protein